MPRLARASFAISRISIVERKLDVGHADANRLQHRQVLVDDMGRRVARRFVIEESARPVRAGDPREIRRPAARPRGARARPTSGGPAGRARRHIRPRRISPTAARSDPMLLVLMEIRRSTTGTRSSTSRWRTSTSQSMRRLRKGAPNRGSSGYGVDDVAQRAEPYEQDSVQEPFADLNAPAARSPRTARL